MPKPIRDLRQVWPTLRSVFILVGLSLTSGCRTNISLVDDAGGRAISEFPELKVNAFAPMDGGMPLTQEEIQGRNTWNLWCAGNEQFWDRMARESHGLVDLLKTVDSRRRGSRFKEMGLINQPGCRAAAAPDKFGLWLDDTAGSEPAGIDPKVNGRPTGILGFRLFENPEFKGAAAAQWDPARYYVDARYASQTNLVRPYRVGIACGACHIAFNPCRPPNDPEDPAWENLSSGIGNQYFREGRVFIAPGKTLGFLQEMLDAQPPGTSDTSRIATDHINNPSAINPLVALAARISAATHENSAGCFFIGHHKDSRSQSTPLILKDGADSVGIAGAILRVYVNTGMHSQYWLQQHDVFLGLSAQKPLHVATARRYSVYWRVTEQRVDHLMKFLLRLKPTRLKDAPGGSAFIIPDRLERGAIVFAENCAQCHSSKRPPAGVDPRSWFRDAVLKSEFLEDNAFSDGRRHSVIQIGSNAARALATNAKRGRIWDEFSSGVYKHLRSPGLQSVWGYNHNQTDTLAIPSGGNGYYVTPSLAGLWSSAPFLHNNALGSYTGDPSVAGRMAAFEDAATQLLWPASRNSNPVIWRTQAESYLQIPSQALPVAMRTLLGAEFDVDGWLRIGPVPTGTPINLIANIDLEAPPESLIRVCRILKNAFAEIERLRQASPDARALIHDVVVPALLPLNTCTDFVEDRGHSYGQELSDADKWALIEYLKTL